MAQRVVEQDPQQLPDRVLVTRDRRVDSRALQLAIDVNGPSLAANLGEYGAQLDRGKLETHARVGSGQCEHPIDKARHACRLGAYVVRSRSTHLVGDGWTPREQAGVALDSGQRRAQLMRCVRDESALRVEGVLEL